MKRNPYLKSYKNRFATIEQQSNGSWDIYNDVSGMFIRNVVSYTEAHTTMVEMAMHYSAIQDGRNGH